MPKFAMDILHDLASQPGHNSLHPLLCGKRTTIDKALVILISSDRGLAGAFNINVVKHSLDYFGRFWLPNLVCYVGRKGRDMLYRRKMKIIADFSQYSDSAYFFGLCSDREFVGGLLPSR